jgi:energy-coupling factor transporter ATP-binding protein EcfA2
MSEELRAQVEPLITRLFEGEASLNDLALSAACAHFLLESVRVLSCKKDQRNILSTTTVFLTTLLAARKLENAKRPEEIEPGSELLRLQAWGSALRGNFSRQLDDITAEFFATVPAPDVELFEELPPLQEVEGLKLGPGLVRTLGSLTSLRVVRITDVVLRCTEEPSTGLASRVSTQELGSLVSVLRLVAKTSAGRLTEMSREASESELALNIDDFARAIATIFRTAKGEFTFALFGPWGSGKTTLTRRLKPLLQSPSDYRNATSAENETFARRRYGIVCHNAWKYRTPPEAWIYLYKTLADTAGADLGVVGRFLLALRTSHLRSGLWPILGALMALALVTIPVGATLQLATISGSLLGASALAHIAAVSPKVQTKVRELFNRHATLSASSGNLGMLALVGEDIRALVAAWTAPLDKGYSVPFRQLFLPVAVLAVIAVVWAYGMQSQPEQGRDGLLVAGVRGIYDVLQWAGVIKTGPSDHQSSAVSDWIFFILWCALSAIMTVVPWLSRSKHAPNRVLLIVDDLDRCRPDEMLDVIENMKLLVDDPAVRDRLQVLMLVDESVLGFAITERYRNMIDHRLAGMTETPGLYGAAREEIVTEQKEKLFACHFRLASLQENDISALVYSLSSGDLEAYRKRRREAEVKRRAESARAELDAFERAKRTEREAGSAYREVETGQFKLEPDVAVDGPSDRQPSFRRRLPGMEDVLVPASEAERRSRAKLDEEVKARNAIRRADSKLTPEERLAKYSDVVSAKEAATRERERLERRVREMERVPENAGEARAAAPFTNTDVRFTSDEVDELERLVPRYFRSINRRPSPRAIRLLLFKVQLCRLLMQMRLPARTIDSFAIEKILRAFVGAAAPTKFSSTGEMMPASADDEIVAIAKQVI